MLQILKTKDDSFTLYNKELDETYHSKNGAVQESRHVFIQQGLQFLVPSKNDISILEVGFGTGLNALLTFLEFEKATLNIQYTGIEPFSLNEEIISALQYHELLQLNEEQLRFYLSMHKGYADHTNARHYTFEFKLIKQEFSQCTFDQTFDLIYFDAFAPGKQADLWTSEVFALCHRLLSHQGVLVTYCAKGEVKRILKSTGFKIETLPGPPGKREMVRACKL